MDDIFVAGRARTSQLLLKKAINVHTAFDVKGQLTVGKTAPRKRRSRPNFSVNQTTLLNPKYTFADFVRGRSNHFAHLAALDVAARPSMSYNPLFLCGGIGMGKTHLMHAIGHFVRQQYPRFHICYISSEKFANELISAVHSGLITSFRKRFRNLDVLLLDDVQFFSEKERSQEEFFHTFDSLRESAKQIVVASDRPPKQLLGIGDRLRSRFECGLIADIQPLDLETKIAILCSKAERQGTCLSPDLAFYIASSVCTNVRELEGALIKLIAYCSINGVEPSLTTARKVLNTFGNPQIRKVTIAGIQKTVADWFNLELGEMKARNNSRSVVFPRQVAMFLAKRMTPSSLLEIGLQFGGKHHSTVMHSIERIEEQCATDSDLNELVNQLSQTILDGRSLVSDAMIPQ